MTNQLSNVEPDVSTEGSSHLMNILDWEDYLMVPSRARHSQLSPLVVK